MVMWPKGEADDKQEFEKPYRDAILHERRLRISVVSSEKADSVMMHLLEVMAIMDIPTEMKTDNTPAYVS
ncbi:hypothetical protein STEG23_015555, partial [Scotinomys teguina]